MPLSVTIGAGEGGVVDACGEFGLVRGVDQAGVVDPGRCRRLGTTPHGWYRKNERDRKQVA
jgi:hypothetical protein